MTQAALDAPPPVAEPAAPPSLHESLKHATARDHALVEARVDLMGIDSRLRYRKVLEAFFGFWPGIEARIGAALPGSLQAEWLPRWRAARLTHDLQKVGLTAQAIASLPTCQSWPTIGSMGAALGALYVVEGSSLGARHISRHLHARLGLDAETGAWFFAGHGEQTGACWLRFRELLAEVPCEASQREAVEAASQTFSCLNRWFEENLAHE